MTARSRLFAIAVGRIAAAPMARAWVLAAFVSSLLGSPQAGATQASPSTTERAPSSEVALPALPGPYAVGTRTYDLVDRERIEALAQAPEPRTVIAQLWYPAKADDPHPVAPYMSDAISAFHDRWLDLEPGTFASLRTHAHLEAAPLPRENGWPVVLFSPGMSMSRSLYTVYLQGLASQGFVVVAIDHPYDAGITQLRDGRLITARSFATKEEAAAAATASAEVRRADVLFVLTQLPRLDAALTDVLDMRRVGMFGHSLGGATAALAMLTDTRIAAGLDMDGKLFGLREGADLERPFLLLGSAVHGRQNDQTWTQLWPRLRGFRRELRLEGSVHQTFSDYAPLSVVLGIKGQVPQADLEALVGTLDGVRSADLTLTYVAAFFDQTLRGHPSPLLASPDSRYPEMRILE